MKYFAFLTLLLFSFGSYAAEQAASGASSLTLWPDNGSYISIIIRQVGNKILGESSQGTGLINMSFTASETGDSIAGTFGQGLTNIKCSADHCSGFLNSKSADFTVSDNGTKFQGVVDGNIVSAVNQPNYIQVGGTTGSLELKESSAGVFDGDGVFGMNPFTANLKGSGTLAEIQSPALFIAYLVSPFVR